MATTATWVGMILTLFQPWGISATTGLMVVLVAYLLEVALVELIRRQYPPAAQSAPRAGLFRDLRRVQWMHRLSFVLLGGGLFLFITPPWGLPRWLGLATVGLGMLVVWRMRQISRRMTKSSAETP